MIGQSLPEYIFIRLSILTLRLIAPLSVVYSLVNLYGGYFFYSRILGYYAAALTKKKNAKKESFEKKGECTGQMFLKKLKKGRAST